MKKKKKKSSNKICKHIIIFKYKQCDNVVFSKRSEKDRKLMTKKEFTVNKL